MFDFWILQFDDQKSLSFISDESYPLFMKVTPIHSVYHRFVDFYKLRLRFWEVLLAYFLDS